MWQGSACGQSGGGAAAGVRRGGRSSISPRGGGGVTTEGVAWACLGGSWLWLAALQELEAKAPGGGGGGGGQCWSARAATRNKNKLTARQERGNTGTCPPVCVCPSLPLPSRDLRGTVAGSPLPPRLRAPSLWATPPRSPPERGSEKRSSSGTCCQADRHCPTAKTMQVTYVL